MPVLDDIHVHQKRRVLYVIFTVAFVVLFARLIQLQWLYGKQYGQQAEENSVRIIPKEPIRGYIYDRHGRLVVDNRPSFTVTVMPYEFDRANLPYLARLLAMPQQELDERIRKGAQYSRFVPVRVKRDVDVRTVATIEENLTDLPGVDYQIESMRTYPTNASAAHILGYTREVSEEKLKTLDPQEYSPGDIIGATGLEARYEWAIRGIKGAEYSTVNARGQIVKKFGEGRMNRSAIDGNDLHLTMDFSLQEFAESLFTDKRGALVAIDPTDGGILAFVSKPDFPLAHLSGITTKEVWRDLNTNPDRPLFNRATLTRYPPGSTFKMILAIAALEKGIISPNTHMQCTGAFAFGNKVFKDLHVHGSVNVVDAIQVSCNVFFYKLILQVGLDTWAEYAAMFGFGQQTGLDISEESPGLLPTTEFMNRRYGERGWTRGFLVSLGIGQGELGVTPIQMACYAMLLANKGKFYQPHTVAKLVDRIHDTAKVLSPTLRREIRLSEETWSYVREGMRRVVQEPGGTAASARVRGVESAGKTGTAQNPQGDDHAWYVGFAPFDHPRIAIAVLVENAGFGGRFAAPIAGMCIEKYLYGRLIRNDGIHPGVPTRDTSATHRKPVQAAVTPAELSAGGAN